MFTGYTWLLPHMQCSPCHLYPVWHQAISCPRMSVYLTHTGTQLAAYIISRILFYFFCVHNNLHSYIQFIYIILLSLLKASFIPPVSFINPIFTASFPTSIVPRSFVSILVFIIMASMSASPVLL